ncbi:hypothetical protein EJ06DRAFT_403224 [Trichodelitschia bisporula]|uniref:Uncharacterized protein n=1 Tax=Trichodelitschia bisporula TaxID=703511 RepID=A0A6G1HY02_9PEZI|nr:hypothetical protein EJ06DRAFT_403224 [Trichodelitschia bisporula]
MPHLPCNTAASHMPELSWARERRKGVDGGFGCSCLFAPLPPIADPWRYDFAQRGKGILHSGPDMRLPLLLSDFAAQLSAASLLIHRPMRRFLLFRVSSCVTFDSHPHLYPTSHLSFSYVGLFARSEVGDFGVVWGVVKGLKELPSHASLQTPQDMNDVPSGRSSSFRPTSRLKLASLDAA